MSSIKCGNCHAYHESVADVRECCANGTKKIPVPQEAFGALHVNRYAGSCKLCGADVEAEAGHIEKVNGKWTVFHNSGDCVSRPKPESEDDIDFGEPKPAKHGPDFLDVPAGHYAIKSLTGNNDLDFYRIDRPESGAFSGYMFVKMVIGGKPDARIRGAKRIRRVLQAILDAGPDEAMALYGKKIGQCGRCNRHLTDEISRALGIGPVCREPKS